MPYGMVAFIVLLVSTITFIGGFYAGYRLVRWIRLIAADEAETKFDDIVREHSRKQAMLGNITDSIDSLLSQKIAIEREIGQFASGVLPASRERANSAEREARRSNRDDGDSSEVEVDDIEIPQTPTASGTVFRAQNEL